MCNFFYSILNIYVHYLFSVIYFSNLYFVFLYLSYIRNCQISFCFAFRMLSRVQSFTTLILHWLYPSILVKNFVALPLQHYFLVILHISLHFH